MDGWIKMYRSLQDSDMWLEASFTRGQAWIDLIGLARHEKGHITVHGVRVELDRGDVGWSKLSLSKRWKWSRGKTERFIACLIDDQKVCIKQDNKITTVLTIQNYNFYQDKKQQTEQQTDNKQDTNKNDKNDKKNTEIPKGISTQSSELPKPRKERDVLIDLIIQGFHEYAGHGPLDKQPRNIAQVWKRQTNKLIKEIAPYKAFTFEDVIKKSYAWYSRETNDMKAKHLNTVRKNVAEILYHRTREKYIPGYKKEVSTP